MNQVITYILEAAAIALVSHYFIGKSPLDRGLLLVIVSIAVAHIVVDLFAPGIGPYVRQGSGFSIGKQLVGGGMGLQTALATKRSLKGMSGGGMGLQTALDMQQRLQGQGQGQHGGGMNNGAMPVAQVNTIERFMDDRKALEYYKTDRSTESVHETFMDTLKIKVNQVVPFDATVQETNLPTHEEVSTHLGPLGSELHSGDIINICSGDMKLVLLNDDKFVSVVPKSQIVLNDRLFRLRFKNPTTGEGSPIKYGDSVLIQFTNETGQTVSLNHDGDLNCLVNSHDLRFQLVKKDDPDSKDTVNTKDQILIKKNPPMAEGYLRIGDRVQTNALESNASAFNIEIVRGGQSGF